MLVLDNHTNMGWYLEMSNLTVRTQYVYNSMDCRRIFELIDVEAAANSFRRCMWCFVSVKMSFCYSS